MSVLNVVTVLDAALQKDGRRFVKDTYTLADGRIQVYVYLADPGADTTAIATTRTAAINAQLAEEEAVNLLGI